MATVQTIIDKAYTKVNGEYETVPESGDDFKTYLNVLNQVMEQWAHTPYVKWQSLFNARYTLPDKLEFGKLVYPVAEADTIRIGNTPLDGVYFVNDDGELLAKYKLTDQALFDSSNLTTIAMLVSDGLHLKAFSSKLVGSSIRLPVYVDPPLYTTPTAQVRIDSTPWLIAAMAAFICDASPVPFIARNADKFYKQADILMKEMRENNRLRQHLTINSVTGADRLNPMGTEDIVSLLGVEGVLGDGGGNSVLDGGSA